MEIVHINSEPSWRGGEQQMVSLIELLAKCGIKNRVFCRKGSELEAYALANSIDYMATSFSGLKISDSFALKKFSQGADLLHAHTANAHSVAVYSSLLGGEVPIIASKRTDFPVKSPFKFNHKQVKKILCVSNKIKEITQRTLKDKSKACTVYSGIDTARFNGIQVDLKNKLGLKSTDILIGNCSALAPHKDYYTFIDVAKSLPEYHFVIIGDGPLESELKAYAQSCKNIYFTGFIKDIEKHLKSLDIFLITSETEGLGTSILDAMICNVPVVATAAGGIPEIVIHQKTGLLAPVKDVGQITENLKRMIQDKSLSHKCVQEAFENVSNNFSREATASSTLEIYNSIIEG